MGLDATGRDILRRQLRREGVIKLAAELPTCVIAMGTCCGAHHFGRVVQSYGHEVRLMSPEYARPYVEAQRNTVRDAEAIAEAATRPTMRFVEMKSEVQLDMQSLHRARDRLVAERTALINQLRAFLLERGIIVPQGRCRGRSNFGAPGRRGSEVLRADLKPSQIKHKLRCGRGFSCGMPSASDRRSAPDFLRPLLQNYSALFS